MDGRKRLVRLLFVVLALVLGDRALNVWADYEWFKSLGYQGVFWTLFSTRFVVGAAVFLVLFAFFQLNFRCLRRCLPPHRVYDLHGGRILAAMVNPLHRLITSDAGKYLFTVLSVALSLIYAVSLGARFEVIQKFVYAVPFGRTDPIFGRDAAFYVFKLPFYELLQSSLASAFIVALFLCAFVYLLLASGEFLHGGWRFFSPVKLHLGSLIAGLLVLKAWDYHLSVYRLLVGGSGAFPGAGYTDIHARLPAYQILAVLAVLVAVLVFVGIFKGRVLPVAAGAAVLVAASLLLGTLYPAFVQKFQVEPNEFAREEPYIEYGLDATRFAFGLDDVRSVSTVAAGAGAGGLDEETLEKSAGLLRNLRLWDFRPLQQVYNQLQQLRRYYVFADVDVDRYRLGDQYRQVMLAVRELNQENLPKRAGTWVNRRLQYTHGYGVVMSPANEVTDAGLPVMLLKNIPPAASSPEIEVKRPEIYFGELTGNMVVVNTRAGEFSHPSGERNVYTNYEGQGGVRLTPIKRLLYALHFRDLRLLLSSEITPQSRILYNRTVQDARRLAPYLRYDGDPYPVVDGGRIYWILDAYTVAGHYPYSAARNGINYVRNSVKVVVDAYEGDISFYTSDPSDPVVGTYSRIYPGLYRPLSEMPAGLRAHLRYPEDLFKMQADVFAEYHVRDARVFYNREDEWEVPKEKYSDASRQMEPYYVIMQLPGEEEEEFLLILPFTPMKRGNAVAWLAARCDGEHYGELVLDVFPKDVHAYGPMQVEASIDQDADISAQLTLWNQHGSQVIRGNLLTVPLAGKLLYVKPLFLQAEESAMPELIRVIAFYDGRVVMEKDLQGALDRLFGRAEQPPEQGAATPQAPGDSSALARRAWQLYQEAGERLRAGDWSGYGKAIEELGQVLKEMAGETGR